ncbi:hypothetical protein QU38_00990, partial [Staphylococcus aureus]
AQHGVEQRGLRRVEKGGRVVPPIVHEDVEARQRLDMVPPERGIEEQVAGLQFRHLRGGHGFAEAGMAREIRLGEGDHRNHLAAGRRPQRAGTEIGDLVGRDQGDAPAPGRAAGQGARDVVTRTRRGAVADPAGGEPAP